MLRITHRPTSPSPWRAAAVVVTATALLACGDGSTSGEAATSGAAPGAGDTEATTTDGGGGSAGQELTPVDFRTDVAFNGTHVPFAVGVVNGIYEDHGLDVTINPGQGSAATLQAVATGNADVGFADAGALIRSVPQGLDAVMVAGVAQQSQSTIFALPESGITEPTDLVGRVGSATAGSAPELLFPAFAEANGFDPSDVELRNVDIPTRNSLFMAGDVDFTFGFTTSSLARLEQACECEPVVFDYEGSKVPSLSSGIVVSPSWADENADVVEAFLAATAEASEVAEDDPEAALDAFFELAVDNTEPREVALNAWQYATALTHTEATADWPWGCTAEADRQATVEVLEQYTDLEPGAVDPNAVFTNEYLASCP